MSKADEKMKGSGLSIDRAAFILLRVKRAFKKKKQQLQEKKVTGEIKAMSITKPPPLLRSRTLPSIVVPGLNILQAQIDAKYKAGGQLNRNQKFEDDFETPFFHDDELQGHRSLVFHRLSSPDPGPNMGEAIKNFPPSQFFASAKSYRTPNNPSLSSTALNRLAKLINQKPNATQDTSAGEPAVRRLSWEKGERNPPLFYRSSSIDSIVDPVWQSSEPCIQTKRLHSPLLCRTEKLGTMVSPSLGRKRKGNRLIEGSASYAYPPPWEATGYVGLKICVTIPTKPLEWPSCCPLEEPAGKSTVRAHGLWPDGLWNARRRGRNPSRSRHCFSSFFRTASAKSWNVTLRLPSGTIARTKLGKVRSGPTTSTSLSRWRPHRGQFDKV